jgi:hypothetical protein
MSSKSTSADALLTDLAAAAADLHYPSETDAPLTPFRWAGPASSTPDAASLVASLGRDPATPVEAVAFEAFFAPVTQGDDEGAERFRALRDRLQGELQDLRVYRVGRVDIDVYVLGRHPSGEWVGLQTKVVET